MVGKKNNKNDSLEQFQLPKKFEKFIEELPDRYTEGQIDKEIEQQIDTEWHIFQNDLKKNEKKLIKKVALYSLSLTAAFGLFIGSAFVSPAMAEILSKIPYLNLLLESEKQPINDEITEALDKRGYKWEGVGVSVRPKEVSVRIDGTDKYYSQVKPEVEDILKKILKSRGYNAYKIKVEKAILMEEPTIEDIKLLEQSDEISKLALGVLKQYGYNRTGIAFREGQIDFELPKTETMIDEIKNQINDTLKQNNIKNISIKVYTFDPKKREREKRWLPLIRTISNTLTAKVEYKVKGIGYTNKFDYLPISINTTLSDSDEDLQRVVEVIEKMVEDYLKSKKVQSIIKNDSYEINIYNKKGVKIN